MFYSAESAAKELGLSHRHFRRIAEEQAELPFEIDTGWHRRQFWTGDSIERLKQRVRTPRKQNRRGGRNCARYAGS